jgi:two-component system chemotaxis sensor kinase CheA
LNPLDHTLLQIFAAEQAEHLARIRSLLGSLQGAAPADRGVLFDELLRRAHTLKGAARAVGLVETEQLAHEVEDIFVGLRQRGEEPDTGTRNVINQALDRAEDLLAWSLGQRSKPQPVETFRQLQEQADGSREENRGAPSSEVAPVLTAMDDLVRVDARTLDAVIRTSSNLMASAASGMAAVRRMEDHAAEIESTLREYRRLRRAAAAYLHEDRAPAAAECLNYVDARLTWLFAAAGRIADAQASASWDLRQRVRELHGNTARARMTPADSVIGSFGSMVREMAEREGKQIEFSSSGLHIQADRTVLQSLKDAVMHLLRNAVFHGIETPAERSRAGKPAVGSVRLRVRSRGDRLIVSVEDDGKGLDGRALAKAAIQSGLLTPAAAASASPKELTKLVFHPGFSTSKSVTALSGRGMGLSVVKQTAEALRGDASVRARAGGGTVVMLSLPLSISTQHMLLVSERGRTFALATSQIESVRRTPISEIARVNGRECVVVDSDPVPLVKLSDALRLEAGDNGADSSRPLHVVVLAVEGERAALAVDYIVDDRDITVKESGLKSGEAGFSAGAVALEDGSVAVVLSASAVLDTFLQGGPASSSFITAAEQAKTYRILVVDDSITTRSVERSILEAHGYEVELAVDGVEALEKIRSRRPDLVISDVSMPRMDGFELLERLKSDKQTTVVPVILVTSLESREEQERGLSLGADAYIIKRKFDQKELLEAVRQIL